MHSLWQDLRYSLRGLMKTPLFTLSVVFTLALSLGANTAVFSVINGVLLKPLPFPNAERLVTVRESNQAKSYNQSSFSPGKFTDLIAQVESFEHLAAYYGEDYALTDNDLPEQVSGCLVTSDFFRVLGTLPAQGRTFETRDTEPGAEPVVILSQNLWKKRFGANPEIIGKKISLSKQPYQVIGVMPASASFPKYAEIWVPLAMAPGLKQDRYSRFLGVIGALKPEKTIDQAQAELTAIAARLEAQYPATDKGWSLNAIYTKELLTRDVQAALWTFFAAVGFVLLIACVNIASLLLNRAEDRRKEFAIRTALGASWWRTIQQMLVESLVLSVTGGVLGLGLAAWLLSWLVTQTAAPIPRLREVSLDPSVVGFTFGVTLAVALGFGLIPAIQGGIKNLNQWLKEGGEKGATAGRNWLRSGLVVVEIAFALVLLIGAGLMIRSLWNLQHVETGFQTTHILTGQLSLPWTRFQESAAFYDRVLAQTSALPGVKSASVVNFMPMVDASTPRKFEIEGRPLPPDEAAVSQFYTISPNWFQTLGIPVLQGRSFLPRDTAESQRVLVVNASFARHYFPNADPIGKRINTGWKDQPLWTEIVGVVGDIRHQDLETAPKPAAYASYVQSPWPAMMLVVKTENDPKALVNSLRTAIASVDRAQPLFDIQTLDERVLKASAVQQFNMLVLTVFAGVALLLAAVGIYGVVAYSVGRRRREIGIRLALGAQKSHIFQMILGYGLTLCATGMVLGLAGAFGLTRFVSSLLYAVSPTDQLTFAAISGILLAVSLVACLVPVRRALNVDPVETLRTE